MMIDSLKFKFYFYFLYFIIIFSFLGKINIPNGLPLVYNVQKKCIQLLEDGTGIDPVDRYDFGKAPELIFAPCDIQPEDTTVTAASAAGMDESSLLLPSNDRYLRTCVRSNTISFFLSFYPFLSLSYLYT